MYVGLYTECLWLCVYGVSYMCVCMFLVMGGVYMFVCVHTHMRWR